MPYVRLSAEEKARRKAERNQRTIAKREEKKRIRDEKKQRMIEVRNQLKQIKENEKIAKKLAKPEKKKMKDFVGPLLPTQKRVISRQLRKEARIIAKPAEKSVMKSSFVGPLLPTQRRKRTYVRRNLENIAPVAPVRRRRALRLPVPAPVAPVAPVRRGPSLRLPVRDSVPVLDNLNVKVYPPFPPAPPLRIARGRPRNNPAIV